MNHRTDLRAMLEQEERYTRHNAASHRVMAAKVRARLASYTGIAREALEETAVEYDVAALVSDAKAAGLRLAMQIAGKGAHHVAAE